MCNCIICKAMCDYAGKNTRIENCSSYEPEKGAVIYVEELKRFPNRIIVKERNTQNEKEYIPLANYSKI